MIGELKMKNTTLDLLSRRRLIQSGLLMAAGCAWKPSLLAAAQGAVGSSDSKAAAKTWTIGNDRIGRTLAFDPKTGLFTQQLSDLSTHTDYIQPGKIVPGMATEFSFVCDGRLCAGTHAEFELVSADEADIEHGKSLTIRLRHKELALEVAVVYCAYYVSSGHPQASGFAQQRQERVAYYPPEYRSHRNCDWAGE